jgi:hypothetical protein
MSRFPVELQKGLCGTCHRASHQLGVWQEDPAAPGLRQFFCLACVLARAFGSPSYLALAAPARLVIDVNLHVEHHHAMEHDDRTVERNGQLVG